MPWISIILIATSIIGPLGVYGAMAVREKVAVYRAVKAERIAGVEACNGRVAAIEREHNEAVSKAAEEARAAADAVGRTPETVAELEALCKRSASCRERGAMK